jgi:hypothetical protein
MGKEIRGQLGFEHALGEFEKIVRQQMAERKHGMDARAR